MYPSYPQNRHQLVFHSYQALHSSLPFRVQSSICYIKYFHYPPHQKNGNTSRGGSDNYFPRSTPNQPLFLGHRLKSRFQKGDKFRCNNKRYPKKQAFRTSILQMTFCFSLFPRLIGLLNKAYRLIL